MFVSHYKVIVKMFKLPIAIKTAHSVDALVYTFLLHLLILFTSRCFQCIFVFSLIFFCFFTCLTRTQFARLFPLRPFVLAITFFSKGRFIMNEFHISISWFFIVLLILLYKSKASKTQIENKKQW